MEIKTSIVINTRSNRGVRTTRLEITIEEAVIAEVMEEAGLI